MFFGANQYPTRQAHNAIILSGARMTFINMSIFIFYSKDRLFVDEMVLDGLAVLRLQSSKCSKHHLYRCNIYKLH